MIPARWVNGWSMNGRLETPCECVTSDGRPLEILQDVWEGGRWVKYRLRWDARTEMYERVEVVS